MLATAVEPSNRSCPLRICATRLDPITVTALPPVDAPLVGVEYWSPPPTLNTNDTVPCTTAPVTEMRPTPEIHRLGRHWIEECDLQTDCMTALRAMWTAALEASPKETTVTEEAAVAGTLTGDDEDTAISADTELDWVPAEVEALIEIRR